VRGLGFGALAALPFALASCGDSPAAVGVSMPHVVGKSKEEIGKYIVQIAGCHDCHTPGMLQGGDLHDVPEAELLTGSPLGFNGPWGTTYAPNLRLKVGPYNETMFIAAMRKRADYPPMPWPSLHAMTDDDLGAVFAYIKALGSAGTPMPDRLPPGARPKQPFIVMVPDMGPPPATGAASPPK
jgi:mono/diheme cytochrome c family protein